MARAPGAFSFYHTKGNLHGCSRISYRKVAVMTIAGGPLGGQAYFLHWGVIQISLTNFIIIVVMLVVFVLALILPFPGHNNDESGEDRDERP
jgi:hypothetical protein